MLLTFYFSLIFHFWRNTHFRGSSTPPPTLDLFFVLWFSRLFNECCLWKVHDMAVFPFRFAVVVVVVPPAGFLLPSFDALLVLWAWSILPLRRETTPINKFIALINNCNTVADCSLTGNGFIKWPPTPEPPLVVPASGRPLVNCISSVIWQSAL